MIQPGQAPGYLGPVHVSLTDPLGEREPWASVSPPAQAAGAGAVLCVAQEPELVGHRYAWSLCPPCAKQGLSMFSPWMGDLCGGGCGLVPKPPQAGPGPGALSIGTDCSRAGPSQARLWYGGGNTIHAGGGGLAGWLRDGAGKAAAAGWGQMDLLSVREDGWRQGTRMDGCRKGASGSAGGWMNGESRDGDEGGGIAGGCMGFPVLYGAVLPHPSPCRLSQCWLLDLITRQLSGSSGFDWGGLQVTNPRPCSWARPGQAETPPPSLLPLENCLCESM